MLKILWLSDVPPNINSGAAGTEYQIVQSFNELGIQIKKLWSDDIPSKIKHGNLHYAIELPRAYKNICLNILKEEKYDVVIISQPHGFMAFKSIKQKFPNVLCIHFSHGFEAHVSSIIDFWELKYKFDQRSKLRQFGSYLLTKYLNLHSAWIANNADGHIFSSQKCRKFMEVNYRVANKNILAVHQGLSSDFLVDQKNITDHQRLHKILYVGQFAFVKAPIICAEAINNLITLHPQLEFTWVCSKVHHSEVLNLLSEKARDKVVVLDWMSQKQLIELYDEHGIFIFPSFVEGFGKAALEAMSRGMCVVASESVGMVDLITPMTNGIITSTGNSDEIVSAVNTLISDFEFASNISTQAILTATKCTWDSTALQMLSFFEFLISQKDAQVI
jgi:glycosyltransferase involved in cell wall biosynthesis